MSHTTLLSHSKDIHHKDEPKDAAPGLPRQHNDGSVPDSYRNLVDDNSVPPIPSPNPDRVPGTAKANDKDNPVATRRPPPSPSADYDEPDNYANLDETIDVSPIQNPYEQPLHRYESLEETRSREQRLRRRESETRRQPAAEEEKDHGAAAREKPRVSRLATQIYTISYLILFSILGTLTRLGLQALTSSYPGTPVIFASLWPNFAGSLIMGFLAEDWMLFRHDWGSSLPTPAVASSHPPTTTAADEENHSNGSGTSSSITIDPAALKKSHAALKKTIPLYIGLATGFCGSLTSFSSFIRDMFLALSNDLSPSTPRNDGYSLTSVLAVLLVTISLSLSGLFLGAHLAIALAHLPHPPHIPRSFTNLILDRIVVPVALGCWLAAILLCILPPDRASTPAADEKYRGTATFSLAFAPLGCLARFYASLRLNGRVARFPLGTFAVNVAGTAVLAAMWDLQHLPAGGVVGCQMLQGLQDGFCGCLTTVSTWVAELAALRRRHAYIYGGASVGVAFGVAVAVMGGLRWGKGWEAVGCLH
ncbi:CrcB-like protein-domain-containing protein [Podospora appendiculata]|uniref:CrcB-like protein-domain-containing protein n=1 Tax=Podospora appendiculata TaxID=314037 RepID=A0AAE0XEZ6_9PEZI|nr:CrcB-like protein-domain-containing protein [Podospora appendiculata]